MKMFKYRQPFGLHFSYRHQVDNHNNRRHSHISLYRTWDTKFFPDRNFAWYLAVTEVSTALASGNFQNCGDIMPTLDFWRQVAIQCMENAILIEPGNIGSPMKACRRPQ